VVKKIPGQAIVFSSIAKPKELGLPFDRRATGRAIARGEFPTLYRIRNKLFITSVALEEYKQTLLRGEQYVRTGLAVIAIGDEATARK
jgi:hypothetical protein